MNRRMTPVVQTALGWALAGCLLFSLPGWAQQSQPAGALHPPAEHRPGAAPERPRPLGPGGGPGG